MSFFLNELSLHNQFNGTADFFVTLEVLLRCRHRITRSRFRLFCGRNISDRPVYGNTNFHRAVIETRNPNIIQTVMIWISKDGPFWDDAILRRHGQDDYLECNGEIVTDCALGEAGFRIANRENCSAVSFAPSNFQTTPLFVIWHKENNREEIEVRNFWDLPPLKIHLGEIQPSLECWEDFFETCQREFNNLTFLDSFYDGVKRQPLDSIIIRRSLFLLQTLNELRACFDAQGDRTERGFEIIDEYFTGQEPLFRPESETNKNRFNKELTFRGPDGTPIFCHYHGRIPRRVFRLHFTWPVTADQPLFIAYLGPKRTKN